MNRQAQELKRRIRRYVEGQHQEWIKGGGDPADYQEIEKNLQRAQRSLWQYIDRLLPHEPGKIDCAKLQINDVLVFQDSTALVVGISGRTKLVEIIQTVGEQQQRRVIPWSEFENLNATVLERAGAPCSKK